MTYRLGVASIGVAGMAWFTNPLSTLVGFLILVAGPVCYTAYTSTNTGTIFDTSDDSR